MTNHVTTVAKLSRCVMSFSLMIAVSIGTAALAPTEALAQSPANAKGDSHDGIVRVRSAYGHDETVERLKKDVEAKGIRFFMLIEQSKLAAAAGNDIKPSSLLVFGNAALGTLFIAANPSAGLDWPVRVLVYTDAQGQVWAAYTEFDWIAKRHRITASDSEPFKKASGVITSIVSSVAAPSAR